MFKLITMNRTMVSRIVSLLLGITLTLGANNFALSAEPTAEVKAALDIKVFTVTKSVAFSPDGKTLASVGYESVRLYDTQTGQHKQVLTDIPAGNAVAFSPDGKFIAGGTEGRTVLWDAQTGEKRQTLEVAGHVTSIAFSPDIKTLAIGIGRGLGTKPITIGEVKLWDVQSGELKWTLTSVGANVWSVAFSPDGKMLVSGEAREARLWNSQTGELLQIFGQPAGWVAFAPDGKTVVCVGRMGGNVWDVQTGKLKLSLKDAKAYGGASALSPDGKQLVSSDGTGKVGIWDTETGELRRVLMQEKSAVIAAAFSPDGKLLACGGENHIIKLWRIK